MPDHSDERRDRIHALLQELGPPDDEQAGGLLIGWVLVMEWVDTNGEKWLSRGHSAEISTWHASGLYHEALYGNWPAPPETDE